jgi:crossover junction endodeoxyribonuclease RuvC
VHAYVENVHAMPRQGVSSTFSFGFSFGTVIGCLASLRIPYTLVSSNLWKRQVNIRGKGKDAARTRALQLFPALAEQLNLKRHHGRADALLLADVDIHAGKERSCEVAHISEG